MNKAELMDVSEVTFGVEIETVIPMRSPVEIGGYHQGCRVYTAPTFDGEHWKAQRDGSLQPPPGYRGCEFVSPILKGADGVANLLAMLEWLSSIHAKVNSSTGLHIHIGVDSILGSADRKAVAKFLVKLAAVTNINHEALYAQTGTRRDTNRYCKRLDESTRNQLRMVYESGDFCHMRSLGRHSAVNFKSYFSYRTVEFRAFAGTLNPNKVLHHLWTCLFMSKFARALAVVPWKGRGWASETGGTGEKALRGLHRKMGSCCLVGAMVCRVHSMRKIALEMAKKYDARED